jgi:transcriptional regulator with XRE-family HTH domain
VLALRNFSVISFKKGRFYSQFRWKRICFKENVRLDKESFGPVLRAARERKGVTLKQLAAETKLSVDLWEALEDNNLARWPKRIYARSYVRDYAEQVGLDPDDVVNEFCRLFPDWGDRRAERVIREKAQIIAHNLDWEDLPVPSRRRASDRAASAAPVLGRHRGRLLAIAIDTSLALGLGFVGVLAGFAFWPSAAVAGVLCTSVGTFFLGRPVGLVASGWIFKALQSIPATRRLLSSRTENA